MPRLVELQGGTIVGDRSGARGHRPHARRSERVQLEKSLRAAEIERLQGLSEARLAQSGSQCREIDGQRGGVARQHEARVGVHPQGRLGEHLLDGAQDRQCLLQPQQVKRQPLDDEPARQETLAGQRVVFPGVEVHRAGERGRHGLGGDHVVALARRCEIVAAVVDDQARPRAAEDVAVVLAKVRREVEDRAIQVHGVHGLRMDEGRPRRRSGPEADHEHPPRLRMKQGWYVGHEPHVAVVAALASRLEAVDVECRAAVGVADDGGRGGHTVRGGDDAGRPFLEDRVERLGAAETRREGKSGGRRGGQGQQRSRPRRTGEKDKRPARHELRRRQQQNAAREAEQRDEREPRDQRTRHAPKAVAQIRRADHAARSLVPGRQQPAAQRERQAHQRRREQDDEGRRERSRRHEHVPGITPGLGQGGHEAGCDHGARREPERHDPCQGLRPAEQQQPGYSSLERSEDGAAEREAAEEAREHDGERMDRTRERERQDAGEEDLVAHGGEAREHDDSEHEAWRCSGQGLDPYGRRHFLALGGPRPGPVAGDQRGSRDREVGRGRGDGRTTDSERRDEDEGAGDDTEHGPREVHRVEQAQAPAEAIGSAVDEPHQHGKRATHQHRGNQ